TIIPRNVRLSEAPSYGETIIAYDSACAGSDAYRRLAMEVIATASDANAKFAEVAT
ncbi:MAG: chromosome partitioning protein ParA, partial [Pseudomonadota bacterium]